MDSDCSVKIYNNWKFWMVLSISILLIIAMLFGILMIGLFYTSFNGWRNPLAIFSTDDTFYLYDEKIYVPVTVTEEGKIDVSNIPYYYGKPSKKLLKIKEGNSLQKGNYLGQADADFFYDTDDKKHIVELYTVVTNNQKRIPNLVWAISDRDYTLAAEITKPYSKKMCSVETLSNYAADLAFLLEAKYFVSRKFESSKYYVEKSTMIYRYKRNLYFFYFDIADLIINGNTDRISTSWGMFKRYVRKGTNL